MRRMISGIGKAGQRHMRAWKQVSRVGIAASLVWLGGATAQGAPAFTNAGFEDNGPNYNTAYDTFKTPVTNWTITGSGNVGVMYYTNDDFTHDTGYGSQILGMRFGGGISQTAGGFVPGQNYRVTWQGNSRIYVTGDGWLRVTAGGHIVWGDTCAMHNGSFVPYTSYVFRAVDSNVTIQFENPASADVTTLLDDLQIQETAEPVGPFVDIWPTASSGASVVYTSVDPGFGIPPYEGLTQLRMQMAGSWTMTIREIKPEWTYQVSFYACERPGSPNDFQVSVDGTVLLGGTNYIVGTTWTNQSFPFVATGTTASLTFEALNTAGGDRTVFFDAFRVAVSNPPPFKGTVIEVE